MINFEQMALILEALPDPAFILSRSGKYVAVFGGRDVRYYHDGTGLVGKYFSDLIKPGKADWFLEQIARALESKKLLVEEYELSNRDVIGLPDEGPKEPIWFEGRIQALSFLVDDEEVVLWVASNISERHNLEMRLRELSDTDQLTGLFNRRKLEHELTLHFESLVRYSVPTSIFLFDLDNLKKVNDTKGHHVGDEMIQVVANICRSALRAIDFACRLGGDEFVVVLPNTGREQAIQFAKRLHDRLRKELSRFSVEGTIVTASIGVTTMLPEDRSYEDTLQRADGALYEAKSMGKDRIVSV
ncbi:sensor domain-containing diguanylate cyclase [Pseudomonas sp. DP16D-R1]|uniref:GGDEF domain-containing protein n=1 Tax=Pseudomonas sp. DP16D-R1 TaxID=2075551 RepID=UPI000CD16BD0|nr:sensor domain-containing diguanylate cyclase [Pseudomonas sp. DP16D-R1]POA77331.1 deoxycytidine triphosphate deaminase [Pseudomonas sp. DP16D-R1]